MIDLEKGENSGVFIIVRPTDFQLGLESAVAFEERVSDGDWEKYKPTDEWQRRYLKEKGILDYDTNSCVTFSGDNTLEGQAEYLLHEGGMPDSHSKYLVNEGYVDEQGNVNFSDWFGANTNGTTVNGNDLGSFWNGVRKHGLLPQRDGAEPNDFKNINEWFDKSRITPAMRTKAKRFLDFFTIEYEWVVLDQPGRWDLFEKHVKHAPLHIATGTGSDWNRKDGKPVQPVDSKRLNHATSYFGNRDGQWHKDLDHYNPFMKKLAWDYYIPYAIKGILSVKTAPAPEPPFTYTYTTNLRFGDPDNSEVRNLQRGLQELGYMRKGLFGMYWTATKNGVAALQLAHGIKDPDGAGMNFGPKTRVALTQALRDR